MKPHAPITIEEIRSARERIGDSVVRTPLIRLNVDDAPAEIFLKLEILQPIGSFKLRGAVNAMRLGDARELEKGVWTASTGNMAQGVAWAARQLGLRCTVVVPDSAPRSKLTTISGLGAEIVKITRADWFKLVLFDHEIVSMDGLFIHPASDRWPGKGLLVWRY